MKRVELLVGYNHDGVMLFRAPGAVDEHGYPDLRDYPGILRQYPAGSKLHIEIDLDGPQEYEWTFNERAWIEVPVMLEVGVALATGPHLDAYPELRPHIEEMATAELVRRFPGVTGVTTEWAWSEPTSWEDEAGERHELCGAWTVFATGRAPE